MDKRYQFFISSTFTDLIEERQATVKAVLQLNHMPSGMELFPATDDGAWALIKDVIQESDYYILVVGGRYGSTDTTGLGYTEKEYDYAHAQKKPVLAFLHKEPTKIPRDRTETDRSAWERLETFRKKVEFQHVCRYWSSVDTLESAVILSITNAVKRSPAVGWVRADQVPTNANITDIIRLQKRIQDLEAEITASSISPPPGTEDLASGDYEIELRISFKVVENEYIHTSYTGVITPTWDQIFAGVAPTLLTEASEKALNRALDDVFRAELTAIHVDSEHGRFAGRSIAEVRASSHDYQTCIVQLRALGLIALSTRKRGVNDTSAYWALTPYGDHRMMQLRALRISDLDDDDDESHDEPAELTDDPDDDVADASVLDSDEEI